MLPGTGLSNNTLFTHTLDQKPLAHDVIGLMSPGMIKIFALDVDLAATEMIAEVFSVGQWSRPTGISGHELDVLIPERRIVFDFLEILIEFFKCFKQDLRDKSSSPISVISFLRHISFRNKYCKLLADFEKFDILPQWLG